MPYRRGSRPSIHAFCVPFLPVASLQSHCAVCLRRPFVAAVDWQLPALPIGSIITAGISLGILAATFENMLNVIHKRRRVRDSSDDELCAYCSGFGTVRCEVCNSRGAVFVGVTYFQRVCPACNGKKRERCRRCAGSGKSGMKKSQIQVEKQKPSDHSLQ
ncbi:unnamed protein product [Agarophyton chilense]